MEGLPELTAGRTCGETRAGALLAKLESAREEMYAFNVANASSPGEFEFGFRSRIGLHVDQAERIPQNWADIQKSEFYEEWLSAMRLELDGHIEMCTFSADVVPKGVNVISNKWVFAWKTDSDGYITKAKARFVARDFGQKLGVDYFNTFAPTPTVSSIKVAVAIAVQNDWPLYHFDAKQAFVQAKLDTDAYMKLPYGCALYGIKKAGRQWSAVLCQTLVDEHGMEQCRADPCVYRNIVEEVVKLILVVHVDDILVSAEKEVCYELHHTLNENFPTENLGELKWYLRCAVERDWQQGRVTIKQPAMIDTFTKRFNVTAQSDTPASTVAD